MDDGQDLGLFLDQVLAECGLEQPEPGGDQLLPGGVRGRRSCRECRFDDGDKLGDALMLAFHQRDKGIIERDRSRRSGQSSRSSASWCSCRKVRTRRACSTTDAARRMS